MKQLDTSFLTSRDQGILRVLGITLALNWIVAAAKLIIGVMAGSLTVVADGMHSFLDGSNNVLGLVAIVLAAKPPDQDHPYGHRKFENVAAMMIGGLIVLIAWELGDNLLRTVIGQIRGTAPLLDPQPLNWLFIGVVGVTMVFNILVSRYEHRRGEELNSTLLKADSVHTLSDSVVTGLSLASLLLNRFGWWIDPLLACGVLIFLARAAWMIIVDNLPAFTDRSCLDPEEVKRVVATVSGVRESHRVRSHGTPNDVHMDLDIVVAQNLTAAEVEVVEKSVREALRGHFPNITLIGIRHRTADADTASSNSASA